MNDSPEPNGNPFPPDSPMPDADAEDPTSASASGSIPVGTRTAAVLPSDPPSTDDAHAHADASMTDAPRTAGAPQPHIETYGAVKVDRSGLFNINRPSTNPLEDGCVEIDADGNPIEEDAEEDVTYQVLGRDIPLDASMTELNLSTARIQKLVNLDMIGAGLKKIRLVANLVDRIEGLEACPNLVHLELYQNRIKKIENLENLSHLQHLDLSFNLIRKVEYLNASLPFCENLKTLYLPNNKIETVAAENVTCFPNLEILELGANRLRTVPSLRGLTQLRELWLGKNKITSMGLFSEEGEAGGWQLPFLHTCSLQCNRLEEWDESFFKGCPALVKLYLSRGENNLPDFDFETTFAHLPNLTELDLSQNALTRIPKAFGQNAQALRELWMSSNKVDFADENSDSIAGLWGLTKLECLYLEYNPCWDSNYKDGGPTYNRVLRKVCFSLRQLDAIHLDLEEALEKDKYGIIYGARDNSVRGIRQVEKTDDRGRVIPKAAPGGEVADGGSVLGSSGSDDIGVGASGGAGAPLG